MKAEVLVLPTAPAPDALAGSLPRAAAGGDFAEHWGVMLSRGSRGAGNGPLHRNGHLLLSWRPAPSLPLAAPERQARQPLAPLPAGTAGRGANPHPTAAGPSEAAGPRRQALLPQGAQLHAGPGPGGPAGGAARARARGADWDGRDQTSAARRRLAPPASGAVGCGERAAGTLPGPRVTGSNPAGRAASCRLVYSPSLLCAVSRLRAARPVAREGGGAGPVPARPRQPSAGGHRTTRPFVPPAVSSPSRGGSAP